MGGLISRGYQIGHSLGLSEIHLAIEVGTLGKFARVRHATAVLDELLQHLI